MSDSLLKSSFSRPFVSLRVCPELVEGTGFETTFAFSLIIDYQAFLVQRPEEKT